MTRNRILIVDDDFDTQFFLKILLGRFYDIDFCSTDDECFNSIQHQSYNLIIMDIAIKGSKDGIQITNELKNSDPFRKIPIVCLSAHVLEKDKLKAYEAGADIFLEKPVRNDVLLQTVKNLIVS